MPRYRIVFSSTGEPLPEKLDRSPFQVTDGESQYELSRPRSRSGGQFLEIRPIEADDPEAAYSIAFRVVNGCLNRLCVECNHRTSLEPGYFFQNLDDTTNRGSRGLIQVVDCGEGLIPFPEVIATDGGRRSAGFFRRAQIETDPVDRIRYFSLAIEEAGKRIKLVSKINKGSEAEVIRYTIGLVFKKT